MEIDDLKTEHEAASILGLSVRTLQAKRLQGGADLPYVKFGRAVRYRVLDIHSFIEKNIVGQTIEAGDQTCEPEVMK